ncbi:hypothetical protein [uncultured Acetatifactor sp.]|jgi:hypothetical protein|uniref:hypothetical protein n=1 Tax=uncultured Acetatifactor sp. TaxID=1671927 RepID=UPI00260D2768|nr:hypothetical protein [uncultured Acetatifactor sp.]
MDKYNAAGRIKKVIDIILGLLFMALLGYSFTGAPFHEVAGIVFNVEDIKEICGGTVAEEPLEIYCGDIPYCREQVTEWLKGL